jgi:hypothetical protein
MATPKLTNVSWLGPKDEMDRASHLLGKCPECFEIICVEKAVANQQDTQQEINEMIYKSFGTQVKECRRSMTPAFTGIVALLASLFGIPHSPRP